MEATVTIEGNNVIISTLHRDIILIDSADQYKRWSAINYRKWDGNDLAELYNWMAESDNALRFMNVCNNIKVTIKQLN